MVFIDTDQGGFCLDRYESSPGATCPKETISGSLDDQLNVDSPLCVPASKKGAQPWTYVAMHQAELLCARSGKRLPSNREWYRGAIGTPDNGEQCAIGMIGVDKPDQTGAHDRCVSSQGAYDMVGNVWEWVAETVEDGRLGRELPPEGYISEINDQGVPTQTSTTSEKQFGEDYFFLNKDGLRGIFRGGFWSMQEKAGLYSINVTMPPTFQGGAVGFRCAKSANTPQK
jgi:formylglycine-generating enzyme required for sulfatase activity